MKILLLSLLLLAGLTPFTQAAVLPVGNAGFESPALAANGFTYTLTGGWVRNTNSAANSSFIERVPSFAPQGLNTLGMEDGAAVFQNTPHVFQPNTVYTLTVAVGNRTGHTVAGNLSGYELTAGFAGLSTYAQVDASTAAPAAPFRRTDKSPRPWMKSPRCPSPTIRIPLKVWTRRSMTTPAQSI